jgi:hypothetical protein
VANVVRVSPLPWLVAALLWQEPQAGPDPAAVESLQREVTALQFQMGTEQAREREQEGRLAELETWIQEGEVNRLARVAGYTQVLAKLRPLQMALATGAEEPERAVRDLEDRLELLGAEAERRGAEREAEEARSAALSLEAVLAGVEQKDVKTAWDGTLSAGEHALVGRALAESPPSLEAGPAQSR